MKKIISIYSCVYEVIFTIEDNENNLYKNGLVKITNIKNKNIVRNYRFMVVKYKSSIVHLNKIEKYLQYLINKNKLFDNNDVLHYESSFKRFCFNNFFKGKK